MKAVLPKEVSLEAPPKTELPKLELPRNENKLFDEGDEMVTSTIPDFSVASEEEQETPLTNVWDHAIDILFKLSTVHPDGENSQMWVKYQGIDSMEQFLQWDERQFPLLSGETNPTMNLLMLWKYIHHLVMEAQTDSGEAFSIYFPRTFARSHGKSS